MADNTNQTQETSTALTPDEYRFIGTCEATGQNMSTFVSNISFENLAGLDHYVRSNETTNTDSMLTYYGIGSNIANSLIVCAPTVKEETLADLTQVTSVRYYDVNGSTYYDKGVDYTITPETITVYSTKGEDSTYTVRDIGKYDLVATDPTGRIACLTPQFNDIDNRFFTTFMSTDSLGNVSNNNTYATYSNRIANNPTSGIGATRMLSLNENTANSINSMNNFMGTVGLSYVSILTQQEKNDPINMDISETNNNEVRIQKVKTKYGDFWTAYSLTSEYVVNGRITKIYNKQQPENPIQIESGITNSYIVSFSTLLQDYIDLKNDWDNQFSGDTSDKSISSRVKDLEILVNKLNNLPYVFRGSTGVANEYSQGSYLWAGTYADFKNIEDPEIKNNPNYIYILNESNDMDN